MDLMTSNIGLKTNSLTQTIKQEDSILGLAHQGLEGLEKSQKS